MHNGLMEVRRAKVLLVNGSPHQKGCTYTALSEVAASLNEESIETDFYWIGNKPIGGCIGCYGIRNRLIWRWPFSIPKNRIVNEG